MTETKDPKVNETKVASLVGNALREAVLQQQDTVIELVDIPEWPAVNGHLYVRSMSGTERTNFIKSVRRTIGKGKNATVEQVLDDAEAKLVVIAACDKDGKKVFASEDIRELSKKNARALERIAEHAGILNGLTDDDEEEAKNDSAETPASASSTN